MAEIAMAIPVLTSWGGWNQPTIGHCLASDGLFRAWPAVTAGVDGDGLSRDLLWAYGIVMEHYSRMARKRQRHDTMQAKDLALH
jgi:hypothetical protein